MTTTRPNMTTVAPGNAAVLAASTATLDLTKPSGLFLKAYRLVKEINETGKRSDTTSQMSSLCTIAADLKNDSNTLDYLASLALSFREPKLAIAVLSNPACPEDAVRAILTSAIVTKDVSKAIERWQDAHPNNTLRLLRKGENSTN